MSTTPAFLTDPGLRLILVGGKGGVGKTTVACAAAVARAMANPAGRVMLVSTDPAHSVGDCLGGDPPPVNLSVIEFDAGAKHRAFMGEHAEHLREIARRGTFLDGEDIDRFLDLSLPGLDELMAYLQIATWIEENAYATIVVDTAPTGHALRLLQMPEFIAGWLDAMDALLAKHRYMSSLFAGRGARSSDGTEGFLEGLRTTFDAARALLTDAARCRFVPVMIAEPMSVAETGDLVRELAEMEIPRREVVVNRLVPAGCAAMSHVRRAQREAVRSLPGSIAGMELWGVPVLADEPRGVAALSAFPASVMNPASLRAWADADEGIGTAPAPIAEGAVPLPAPGACRLMFFAGKGGVGKTTMACAAAARLARADAGDILLVSVDPAHSTADCLGAELDGTPRELAPGLFAMELDASGAFAELREKYLGEIETLFDELLGGADLAYDREAMEKLLDLAPPGIDEVMALIGVIDLLDSGRFATVVLDTAPTGHLLRLLHLPELIEQWTGGIFRVLLKYQKIVRLPKVTKKLIDLSKGVKRLRAALRDPEHTTLCAVAVATELALAETRDLVDQCREAQIPLGGLIINQLTPPGGEDELSRVVRARERGAVERFRASFPSIPIASITRGRSPLGLEPLEAVGAAVFASGESVRRAA